MTDEIRRQNTDKSTPSPSMVILGIGNILLGDEGIGVRVIEVMGEMTLPDTVELIDGGTASMDILANLAPGTKVIIIDAVQGGGEAGTIYRFTPKDIKSPKPVLTSLHQVGLLESLSELEMVGRAPPNITIYGIEPKNLEWSLELSPEINAIVPRLINMILMEID
jgi:hydrogenase maturation protease